MTREQSQLLSYIQILDFTLYDLSLFLDTHPNDTEALQYYHHYNLLRNKSVEEYSALYGPLTAHDACKSETEWMWVQQPWPWEGVCS